jgi:predicted MFS family arabinose efflux permease
VFFGHQIGSFFGGWGGGWLYDLQGNYDTMWWISIGLGLVSAALHYPIVEERLSRPAAMPQPA